MSKISDIKVKKGTPLNVDENFVLQGTKIKSPHVIDLRNRPRLRHEHPNALQDVTAELQKGLTSKCRYEERYDPPVRIASRFSEMMRMAAIGVTMVVILNLGAVYYRGVELKDEVATAAYSSYESILEEGPSEDAFLSAGSIFEDAQESLWFLQNQRVELLSQNKTAAAVSNLLTAGEELSAAGAEFMKFVDDASAVSTELLTEKIQGQSATGTIKTAYDEHFQVALSNLLAANDRVQSVSTGLFPEDLKATIEEAKTELAEVTTVLSEFNERFPLLLGLLGDEHPQRYLVLLENNNEARPGGGFIGSYLIIDLNDGYLDGMSFNDVYEIDGQYYKTIDPPGEIASLTTDWRFRDSNYSPDMAVSAAKAAWFLEEEGGPGVDHVITVDLEFVAQLLAITGPIKIDELPIALNEENFSLVISYMVESKYTGAETPKDILGSFVEKVQEKLREQEPWFEIVQLMQGMASSKHFAAYSQDEKTQAFFEDFGVAGAIVAPTEGEDYFALIHTSIGGNKSDAYVTQAIEHQTLIEADGNLLNEVKVTRTHTWTDFEEIRLKNLLSSFGFSDAESWVVDILGGAPNTSIFRLYVPHGTRLISSQGVDMEDIELQYDEDLKLDYFYFKNTVYPGESSTFSLVYELPFNLDFSPLDEYRMNVIKQPGESGTTFLKTIVGDPRLTHYRSFPEELIDNSHEERINVYQYEVGLDQDLHLAQLWGK